MHGLIPNTRHDGRLDRDRDGWTDLWSTHDGELYCDLHALDLESRVPMNRLRESEVINLYTENETERGQTLCNRCSE